MNERRGNFFYLGRMTDYLLVEACRGLSDCENSISRWSNLRAFPLKPFKDGLECAIRKSALLAALLIVLVSITQSLRPKVEGVAKWLMYTGEDISACHEYLQRGEALAHRFWHRLGMARCTLSKAVEHARGWVATKMGLLDMMPPW